MKIQNKIVRLGDHRVVKRFAWLPVRIDAETLVWLEPYYDYEVRVATNGRHFWHEIDTTINPEEVSKWVKEQKIG